MKWITSSGGPLVLLPVSALPQWQGVFAKEGSISDYETACSIEAYAGVIRWRGRDVLVLDDEPNQTALWEDQFGCMLVRWMYAPDETAVIHRLRTIRSSLPAVAEIQRLNVVEREHILIDAAIPGQSAVEKIELYFSPNIYEVRTYVDKPTEELGLIVHMFAADN